MRLLHLLFPCATIHRISVPEFISGYGPYLDARWFGAIRIVGSQPLIYNHSFDEYRDTAVGLWIRLWHL